MPAILLYIRRGKSPPRAHFVAPYPLSGGTPDPQPKLDPQKIELLRFCPYFLLTFVTQTKAKGRPAPVQGA